MNLEGVKEKLCTATHPSPTIRCMTFSTLSTQCECSVTPIGWAFGPISVQPIAAHCLRGRGGNRSYIQFFLNTLYLI